MLPAGRPDAPGEPAPYRDPAAMLLIAAGAGAAFAPA
jgi:hypothetical protein